MNGSLAHRVKRTKCTHQSSHTNKENTNSLTSKNTFYYINKHTNDACMYACDTHTCLCAQKHTIAHPHTHTHAQTLTLKHGHTDTERLTQTTNMDNSMHQCPLATVTMVTVVIWIIN